MARFKAHQRKILTSVTLGCWVFALFVGVVHACGMDEALGHSQQMVSASIDRHGQGDDDAGTGCVWFCADNLPVLAKLQMVQDQPGGQALIRPLRVGEPLFARMTAATSRLDRPHPPPGIALNIRFVRLAL